MKKIMLLPLIAAFIALTLCGCALGKTDASPFSSPVANDSPGAVNLIQSFSVEEQQTINRFVRDVITYGDIENYPNVENVKLLEFVIGYLGWSGVEHILETDEAKMSAADVDDILQQYFGHTIVHGTVKTEYGHLYKYRDGYYYWLEASGYNLPAPMAFVEELYKEQDGSYRANYSVYWIDMALSDPTDFSYLSPGEEYWDYVPEKYETVVLSQVANFPELEKKGTGTVILEKYIDGNGIAAYQLVSFPK